MKEVYRVTNKKQIYPPNFPDGRVRVLNLIQYDQDELDISAQKDFVQRLELNGRVKAFDRAFAMPLITQSEEDPIAQAKLRQGQLAVGVGLLQQEHQQLMRFTRLGDMYEQNPGHFATPGQPVPFASVVQGSLGNCYFLAALQTLISHSFLIEPEKRSDAGLYLVPLFLNGHWQSILVDDRVPTSTGMITTATAPAAQQCGATPFFTFPSGLEKVQGKISFAVELTVKAAAKVVGGFYPMEGGVVPFAARLLSGGNPYYKQWAARRGTNVDPTQRVAQKTMELVTMGDHLGGRYGISPIEMGESLIDPTKCKLFFDGPQSLALRKALKFLKRGKKFVYQADFVGQKEVATSLLNPPVAPPASGSSDTDDCGASRGYVMFPVTWKKFFPKVLCEKTCYMDSKCTDFFYVEILDRRAPEGKTAHCFLLKLQIGDRSTYDYVGGMVQARGNPTLLGMKSPRLDFVESSLKKKEAREKDKNQVENHLKRCVPKLVASLQGIDPRNVQQVSFGARSLSRFLSEQIVQPLQGLVQEGRAAAPGGQHQSSAGGQQQEKNKKAQQQEEDARQALSGLAWVATRALSPAVLNRKANEDSRMRRDIQQLRQVQTQVAQAVFGKEHAAAVAQGQEITGQFNMDLRILELLAKFVKKGDEGDDKVGDDVVALYWLFNEVLAETDAWHPSMEAGFLKQFPVPNTGTTNTQAHSVKRCWFFDLQAHARTAEDVETTPATALEKGNKEKSQAQWMSRRSHVLSWQIANPNNSPGASQHEGIYPAHAYTLTSLQVLAFPLGNGDHLLIYCTQTRNPHATDVSGWSPYSVHGTPNAAAGFQIVPHFAGMLSMYQDTKMSDYLSRYLVHLLNVPDIFPDVKAFGHGAKEQRDNMWAHLDLYSRNSWQIVNEDCFSKFIENKATIREADGIREANGAKRAQADPYLQHASRMPPECLKPYTRQINTWDQKNRLSWIPWHTFSEFPGLFIQDFTIPSDDAVSHGARFTIKPLEYDKRGELVVPSMKKATGEEEQLRREAEEEKAAVEAEIQKREKLAAAVKEQAAKREEAERNRLEEERRVREDAERKRLDEERRVREAAAAEKKRLQEEAEKARKAAEEAEQARRAAEEARRAAAEAEQKRRAAEEAEQARREAEQTRRAAAEAEQKRMDAAEARKQSEALRQKELEQQEEERRRRLQDEEQRRRREAAEAEERSRKATEAAERLAQTRLDEERKRREAAEAAERRRQEEEERNLANKQKEKEKALARARANVARRREERQRNIKAEQQLRQQEESMKNSSPAQQPGPSSAQQQGGDRPSSPTGDNLMTPRRDERNNASLRRDRPWFSPRGREAARGGDASPPPDWWKNPPAARLGLGRRNLAGPPRGLQDDRREGRGRSRFRGPHESGEGTLGRRRVEQPARGGPLSSFRARRAGAGAPGGERRRGAAGERRTSMGGRAGAAARRSRWNLFGNDHNFYGPAPVSESYGEQDGGLAAARRRDVENMIRLRRERERRAAKDREMAQGMRRDVFSNLPGGRGDAEDLSGDTEGGGETSDAGEE
ncbi:unnamed protein product [Amoebophrya sp. A120]|nr:unnamed protein product [Amoebophrya sp. A120]|eukprot:GSA120T00022233001.1